MSAPILGFGTTWETDFGAGFVPIVRNVMIGEFGGESDDVDVTTHDTSTSGFREFIRGLMDGGEIPLTGIYIGDASQAAVITNVLSGTDAVAGAVLSHRATLPQGYGVFEVDGYFKRFKINPQLDGRLEASYAVRASGLPSFSTTASTGLTTPFFTMNNSAVITPAPANATYDYVATVLTGVTSVTVTPTAAAGVIRVNGNIVTSGVASSAIALGAAGSVTTITVTVKETDKITKTYYIRVARASS